VSLLAVGVMGASPTALKPFDPVVFQGVVEATAKELLLPRTDTHFRAASTSLS
jgi:hypothetical protein